MARNDAIEAVLRREREGKLWETTVLGFPVWPLERLRHYRAAYLDGGARAAWRSSQPAGRSRWATELRAVTASLRDLAEGAPPLRPSRDVWVLSSSGYRRSGDPARPECSFAEHLREQLGDRLLFLEFNTARLPSLGRDDVCFADALQVPLLASARLGGFLLGPTLGLVQRGTLAPLRPTGPARAYDRAVYGRGLGVVARRWLDAAPPRAVFVLDAYGMWVPLQREVRRRGIPLIELQHGMIHDSHPGYVLPDDAAVEAPDSPVPDHIVVFGEHFGRTLESAAPHWCGRWSVGGHPGLAPRAAEAAGVPDTDRDTVVLFGQYDDPVRRRMRELATALARRVRGGTRVVIKPHPREPESAAFYRPAVEAGAELAGPGEDPYRLLGRCRVAVSEFSTVAVEALAFPCASVVLRSPHWSEVFHDLVEQRVLIAADGASDILAALDSDAAAERGNLARDLFGIGATALDFEALIGAVRFERADAPFPGLW